jgi:hypothetical protein
MVGDKGGGAGPKRTGLGTIEPGGVNHLLEFSLRNGGESSGVGTAGKESRGDLIHSFIGALSRKNGGDEEFERSGEVKCTVGIGICAFEDVEDSGGPASEGRGGVHGVGGAEVAGRD